MDLRPLEKGLDITMAENKIVTDVKAEADKAAAEVKADAAPVVAEAKAAATSVWSEIAPYVFGAAGGVILALVAIKVFGL